MALIAASTIDLGALDQPKDQIRTRALASGFEAIGFAPARYGGEAKQRLAEFIANGYHGEMAWLAANSERRSDLQHLWPEARSAIVLGVNYAPDFDPLDALANHDRGIVSVYALGADYHEVIKARLRPFAAWIAQTYDAEVKFFIDTAPLLEKPLAMSAGIGWQGKHTNMVSRHFGSWLFLAEILTNLELLPDAPEHDHCGSCQNCLNICPTNAFPAPYRLDARRCISYLTIEHKSMIPREFRVAIGNRIYGCDDCLAVCPWNKFATPHDEPLFAARFEHAGQLKEFLTLDEPAFRAKFRTSPIKRTGYARFLRNVLIAAGNSGDGKLVPPVQARLDDNADLIRAAAIWALGQLAPDIFAGERARRAAHETIPAVAEEWFD